MTDIETNSNTKPRRVPHVAKPLGRVLGFARQDAWSAGRQAQELVDALAVLQQALTEKMNRGSFDNVLVQNAVADVAKRAEEGFGSKFEHGSPTDALFEAAISALLRDGLEALAYDGTKSEYREKYCGPANAYITSSIPVQCWEALKGYR